MALELREQLRQAVEPVLVKFSVAKVLLLGANGTEPSGSGNAL